MAKLTLSEFYARSAAFRYAAAPIDPNSKWFKNLVELYRTPPNFDRIKALIYPWSVNDDPRGVALARAIAANERPWELRLEADE